MLWGGGGHLHPLEGGDLGWVFQLGASWLRGSSQTGSCKTPESGCEMSRREGGGIVTP